MSAAEVVVAQDVKTELATYCLVKTLNDKGEEQIEFMTEARANKTVEDKKGEIVASQSFQTYNVGTDAGFSQIVPSEKERVRLANRGLDQKQYQVIRTTMLETDKEGNYIFQPKAESIDLAKDVAEEVQARATTPEAKLEKVLEGMDAGTAAALLAKLQARFSTAG